MPTTRQPTTGPQTTPVAEVRADKMIAALQRAGERAHDGANALGRALSSPAILAALCDEQRDAELRDTVLLLRSAATAIDRYRTLSDQMKRGEIRAKREP